MKSVLEQLLVAAARTLTPEPMAVTVERSHDPRRGHFSSSVALRLARRVAKSPRETAQALVEALPPSEWISKAEVAGNGFINFFLAPAALAREIRLIHGLGDRYGRSPVAVGKRVKVSLISDPVDVAQARYAAHAQSLLNLLAAAGYEVEREDVPAASPGNPTSPVGSEQHSADAGPSAMESCLRPVTFRRGNVPARIDSFRQLRDEVGDDACRFFFLMRGPEQGLDFDLRLARARTTENPLYSVQYAHARVASAMKEVRARGTRLDIAAGLEALERLDRSTERTLLAALPCYPGEVESAAANCAPHSIVYYLREVANSLHDYHTAETWFVADDDLRNARLALVLAAGQVIRNGLTLIGVSAPESM